MKDINSKIIKNFKKFESGSYFFELTREIKTANDTEQLVKELSNKLTK